MQCDTLLDDDLGNFKDPLIKPLFPGGASPAQLYFTSLLCVTPPNAGEFKRPMMLLGPKITLAMVTVNVPLALASFVHGLQRVR